MGHPEYRTHNVPDLEVSLDRIADSLDVTNVLLWKISRHMTGDLTKEQEEAVRVEALKAAQALRRDRLKLQAALADAPHEGA